MLANKWSRKKALLWALEMVLEKTPMSERLLPELLSNEKAEVWTFVNVR